MKKTFLIAATLFSIISCNRFLDIQPTGQVIPTTIEDYDLLLNSSEYTIHTLGNEIPLALTADNLNYNPSGGINTNNIDNQEFQLYTFSNLRFANPNKIENSWNNGYANIYIYNKIINEIDQATPSVGYSENNKAIIKSQALFGRALDYFYLINTFAKHYHSSNLSSDGVPLILEANVTQSIGNRNSVGEVYSRIIKDLEDAIPHLPTKGQNKTYQSLWICPTIKSLSLYGRL